MVVLARTVSTFFFTEPAALIDSASFVAVVAGLSIPKYDRCRVSMYTVVPVRNAPSFMLSGRARVGMDAILVQLVPPLDVYGTKSDGTLSMRISIGFFEKSVMSEP